MKRVDPRKYAMNLQGFIQDIGKTNERVSPYYEKIKEFVDAKNVDQMPEAEYKDVVIEFQDAADKYAEMNQSLKGMEVPVKAFGMHQNMVKYFDSYAKATAAMATSLSEDKQEINLEEFNQSDEDQGQYIEKFQSVFTKLITSPNIR